MFGLLLAACDISCVVTVLPMDTPAAACGDASDLLHIYVDHVTGPLDDDLLRLTVGIAVGVDEPATVQAERGEMARHRAVADFGVFGLELEGDPRSRPLLGAA